MEIIFSLLGLIQMAIIGVACGYIAKTKGRSEKVWFVLGLIFGIFALTIILILSIDKASKSKIGHKTYDPYEFENYI